MEFLDDEMESLDDGWAEFLDDEMELLGSPWFVMKVGCMYRRWVPTVVIPFRTEG